MTEKQEKSTHILPAVDVFAQEGVITGQTADISNIVKLIRDDIYRPASDDAPNGELLCPDGVPRHIIGHNTSIDGGVHLSHGLHQNIIVDHNSDEVLKVCYQHTREKLLDLKKGDIGQGLQEISKQVQHFLPYSAEKVIEYLRNQPLESGGGFQKLGDFIKMDVKDGRVVGAGLCLHQALLYALFVEQAVSDGVLEGYQVGVFRNHDTDEMSAHAWVVVQDDNEELWVVDPAQNNVTNMKNNQDFPWKYGLEPVQ